jgi:hypothetical protein
MESNVATADYVESHSERLYPNREAHSSGVSWGAVFGGAFVAAAVYLILLALGAGLGLSAVSPWSNNGASASTISGMAIVWLLIIEIIASGMGGYLTGRLRTKWAAIHTDEVYFRDTANGFLAWAVALVISVTFLASAATTMMAGVAPLGADEGAGIAAATVDSNGYFVDTLFRSDQITAEERDPAAQAEAARILMNSLRQGQISPVDQEYLAQLTAAKTGISVPEANQRVASMFANAMQAADTARKATAHLLLWLFLSLLMGAFSASYAATIGGRQRDHVKAV